MKAVALAAALALTPAALAATPTPARLYAANLAFAQCMRAHGVPHPDPDRKGDFTLTPSDERKMRAVGHARVEAAEEVCFRRHLKGVVSTKPLSPHAKAQALEVLVELRTCLRGYGFEAGRPVVENLTLGRAFFGFRSAPRVPAAERKRLAQAQHTCEQRVRMARRIDAIVAADRSAT
jgi:hypothetical protein